MKKILITALAAVIAAGSATAASAQAYGGYRGDRDRDGRYEQRHDSYDRYDRRDYREDRRDRRDARQQHRRWVRGQYMPAQYRGRGYVVNDYRRYHLAPPPRGYHYVRDGNDVILAAIATGLIVSIFANSYR